MPKLLCQAHPDKNWDNFSDFDAAIVKALSFLN